MNGTGIRKRSVLIAGHASSVSMETEFWDVLKRLAAARHLSLNALISEIDSTRQSRNLSSALRVFVLTSVDTQR